MSIFTEEDFDNAATGGFVKFDTPGKTVEGEITKVDYDRQGEYGPQDVYTFKTDEGVVLVGASSILADKLKAEGAKPGVLAGIRYNGKRTSKNGREYKDYSVIVKKPSLFDNTPAPTAQAPTNPPAADASDCPF